MSGERWKKPTRKEEIYGKNTRKDRKRDREMEMEKRERDILERLSDKCRNDK